MTASTSNRHIQDTPGSPQGPSQRAAKPASLRPRRIRLPGFGPSLGLGLAYMSLLIYLPLAALFIKAHGIGIETAISTMRDPRTLAAFRLTFAISTASAVISGAIGLLVAWVIVRYPFRGRRILDALIDLPFALPTAVAGLAFADLYAQGGWIGRLLLPLGIRLAYTPAGMVLVLVFVGFPFVVRSLEPVLMELDAEWEEAAASLGASRWQAFLRVLLPPILPAWIAGMAMAFARGIGEYGSVIFISGNMPMRTEIIPLLIMSKLEQFDYSGATILAAVSLLLSFAVLLAINLAGHWGRRHG